jgi:hypothetical protein
MARTVPPTGIVIIAGLGILDALFAMVGGFSVTTMGVLGAILGPLVVAIAAAKLLISLGLLTMNYVAWILAMGLFGLGFVLDVMTVDVVGILVGVLVLTYLYMVRDEYQRSERSVGSAHGDIR